MADEPPHVEKPPHDELLTQMAKSMKVISEQIPPAVDELENYAKRTRRILRVAIAGIILDLALTFGLGFNAWRTQRALDAAQNSQEAARLVCEEANNLRRAELNLWLPLLTQASEPGSPPRTPEQVEAAEQFEATLRQSFAPQDCTKFR